MNNGKLTQKTVDNFIVYISCFWLFTVLNSFFVWNSLGNAIRALAAIAVFFATLILYKRKKIKILKRSWLFFLAFFLFYLYLTMVKDSTFASIISRASAFLPMMLIIFWPPEYINNTYRLFRRWIIFFAIGSTLIVILSFSGLISYIPYYVLEAQSALHERHDVVYHVYFCFVTIAGNLSVLPRACGMLQEPGHFSIILGFIYLIDRILKKKPSFWIIICGILTFSFNFILIAVISEIYYVIYNHNFIKTLKVCLGFIALLVIIFMLLPPDLQEIIYYLAYERNMAEVVDSLSTGSLQDALDERINQQGAAYYSTFIRSKDIWFGRNINDDTIILSDYRGMLLHIGIIGLIISMFTAIKSSNGISWKTRIPIICTLCLVLLHRSWMFYAPYLYFIPYMVSTVYKYRFSDSK